MCGGAGQELSLTPAMGVSDQQHQRRSVMAERPSVSELLDRWQATRKQGCAIALEELCADCPDLLDRLRQQVEALLLMNDPLETAERQPADDHQSATRSDPIPGESSDG